MLQTGGLHSACIALVAIHDENAEVCGARVLKIQEVRADLKHLNDIQVRRHGELLRERGAVNELDRGENRRTLLVRLDLFNRGHKARCTG